MKTVLVKEHEGHVVSVCIRDDEEEEKIRSLCSRKYKYKVKAIGKPDNYTERDGWLEYNKNDMVLTATIVVQEIK